ncbi:hypothetical protein LTR78_005222 [Recurvomyces mirabilis]|uniref:Apple domain-containing protein n=1 Tax=Recurvomyces mirabilis TaxID=574656 RepID=A0AAE1C1Y5_9PEZI|nr:hypothetical protein LTR78_005222 [Recurvomyces mirabilis]KAK5157772.1 hypothetical protein LTS14_003694 [Recurvomyces mirabilis]
MRRFGLLAFVAGLWVTLASAQSSTTLSAAPTFTPTTAWSIPNGACSSGGSNANGGVFEDVFGNFWEVSCGQGFSGSNYYDPSPYYETTTGIGMQACFNGCAQRVNCIAFTFYGTTTSGSTGTGVCFNYYGGTQGSLLAQSSTNSYSVVAGSYPNYGSAYLIQQNTVQFPCPSYNGSYYNDAYAHTYYVLCGFDGGSNIGPSSNVRGGPNAGGCFATCDTASGATCNGIDYGYGGAEQSTTQGNGQCNNKGAIVMSQVSVVSSSMLAIATIAPPTT